MRVIRGGAAPKFDLSECVLDALPAQAPLEFVEPPNWAIGAVTRAGGRRLPKFKRDEPAWVTNNSYSPMPWYGCADYEDSMDTGDTSGRSRRKPPEPKVAPFKQAELGNLPNEEYRFWRGFAHMPGSTEATCRWCGRGLYGDAQRKGHHAEKHCNSKLLKVYKLMMHAKPKICMVCKSKTHYDRWGVPLCNTVACIARWKFSPMHLLDGWVEAKNFALSAGYLDGFPDEAHNNSRGVI